MAKTIKIEVHNYEKEYSDTLRKLAKREDVSPANKEIILKFCNDCLDGRTVLDKARKRISLAGVRKYLFSMVTVARNFNADFDKIDAKDKDEPNIRTFIKDIESNKIKSIDGKNYAEKTKKDIKVTFRKFMKWKYGDNINFPPCVQYIDTSLTPEDIPALSRDEITHWANRESTLRRKAAILFLFDSGARAEEFLNIRMKHIKYDENEKSYKIRIEFSKTKPRTIYIPITTESLRHYIDSYDDRDNPEAPLFPITYNGLRKFIGVSSKKYLKQHITPHGLRHSSATYYCTRINPYQMCYRYGWSMSSDMPNRYIDREGVSDKASSKAIKLDVQGKIEQENQKLKEELFLQKQNIQSIHEEQEKFRKEVFEMMETKHTRKLEKHLEDKK